MPIILTCTGTVPCTHMDHDPQARTWTMTHKHTSTHWMHRSMTTHWMHRLPADLDMVPQGAILSLATETHCTRVQEGSRHSGVLHHVLGCCGPNWVQSVNAPESRGIGAMGYGCIITVHRFHWFSSTIWVQSVHGPVHMRIIGHHSHLGQIQLLTTPLV